MAWTGCGDREVDLPEAAVKGTGPRVAWGGGGRGPGEPEPRPAGPHSGEGREQMREPKGRPSAKASLEQRHRHEGVPELKHEGAATPLNDTFPRQRGGPEKGRQPHRAQVGDSKTGEIVSPTRWWSSLKKGDDGQEEGHWRQWVRRWGRQPAQGVWLRPACPSLGRGSQGGHRMWAAEGSPQ